MAIGLTKFDERAVPRLNAPEDDEPVPYTLPDEVIKYVVSFPTAVETTASPNTSVTKSTLVKFAVVLRPLASGVAPNVTTLLLQ